MTRDPRPVLDPLRLITLIQAAIDRCQLALSGSTVLTEAASGVYVSTLVTTAMAGAKQVFELTEATRYGSIEELRDQTLALAGVGNDHDRIDAIIQKFERTQHRLR